MYNTSLNQTQYIIKIKKKHNDLKHLFYKKILGIFKMAKVDILINSLSGGIMQTNL